MARSPVSRVSLFRGSTSGCALLIAALKLCACGGDAHRDGFLLRESVERGLYSTVASTAEGLVFSHPPELSRITFAHERRPAVLTSAGVWRWEGDVPPRARLRVGFQLSPKASNAARAVEVRVEAVEDARREIVDVARAVVGDAAQWVDLESDLSRYAGRRITLVFSSTLVGASAKDVAAPAVVWAPVSLSAAAPSSSPRPSLLLIVVDTLRHDRLIPYGYARETSPELQHRLAERGVVFEDAYSQAPWTLPSAISYMTSRNPGELVGEDPRAFSIPDELETLPEILQGLGYETAAFIANPSLSAENGFERGFRTFYSPPQELASLLLHAGDEVNPRAVRWLRAHQSRPFFLYVHYLDPHDPYDNADLVNDRSSFYPDYAGTLSGRDVHSVYAGSMPLTDPPEDAAHLSALYDSEVRYVDRHVGELLASLESAVLENTLVVFTSDHGEELFEHGGWKHGQSLYEHQIHVPLLMRWDRGLPTGARVRGTVRLLDLVPTLVAAAGGPISPDWSGGSLLPTLRGEQPLPELSAYSQHHSSGPLRASVVEGRKKLILFNPHVPFAPADRLQEHLWRNDLARLERRELYDLSRDPAERHNLADEEPELLALLGERILRQLDRQLTGLRMVLSSWPEGSRVGGRIVFDQPPEGWTSLFLADGDAVRLRGAVLEIELTGEALAKGVVVRGELAGLQEISLTVDGQPVAAGQILLGAGEEYSGGAVPPEALRADSWIPLRDVPTLRLWVRTGGWAGRQVEDPSRGTERALRALGYIE